MEPRVQHIFGGLDCEGTAKLFSKDNENPAHVGLGEPEAGCPSHKR